MTDLLGSRICHDLVSPLGAIANGVELLSMRGDMGGAEMDLINESVGNALARIRFFRIAFGTATGDQSIGEDEARSILGALNSGGRLAIDWQAKGAHPRAEVKVAFLAIQCLESAMPRGGRITVSTVGGDWAVTGEADKLDTATPAWDRMAGSTAEVPIDAAHIQFALAPLAAAAIARSLGVERSAGIARIRF